uniref:Uncharacterized protein n=1 Tax=Populus alba TaxID=43335 RepID=A0A4U5N0K6_POPAL|nr:hypothetical protein D5086_0000285210 [Populus alba]
MVKLSTACASRMNIEFEGARASNGEDYDMTRNIMTRLNIKLDSSPPQQDLSERCIYKVPNLLRNVKPEAYTPQLISIGPLHHGDAKLEIMEREKLICFREFKRNYRMSDERIMDLVNIIRNKEKNIRQYYSKNFDKIGGMDFIEMILLDAVFIIEFLKESNDVDGPKNIEPWMMSDIKEDLKLLENQLPFFIIEEIYDEVHSARQESPSIPFLRLATLHFGKKAFSDESVLNKACVNSEVVDKAVKEIMSGEKAEETRSRANSFGDMARKAVEDGGSSYNDSSPVDFTSDI